MGNVNTNMENMWDAVMAGPGDEAEDMRKSLYLDWDAIFKPTKDAASDPDEEEDEEDGEEEEDIDLDFPPFALDGLLQDLEEAAEAASPGRREETARVVDISKPLAQAQPSDRIRYGNAHDRSLIYGVRCFTMARIASREALPTQLNDYPALIFGEDYIRLGEGGKDALMYVLFSCPSVYLRYRDSPPGIPLQVRSGGGRSHLALSGSH